MGVSLPPWLAVTRGPSLAALRASVPPWPELHFSMMTAPPPELGTEGAALALGAMRNDLARQGRTMRLSLWATDWPAVAADDLVALCEAGLWAGIGVETCAPPDTNGELRRPLMYECLLRRGLVALLRGESSDAMAPARNTLGADLGGVFAWGEMERRGRGHVGFEAARLRLIAALPGPDGRGRTPGIERHAAAAVERIARSATAQARGRGLLRPASDARGLGPGDVRAQVPLTVARRWGGLDPLVALARAVEGGLDIAPRAVADDVADEADHRRLAWSEEPLPDNLPPDDEDERRETPDPATGRDADPRAQLDAGDLLAALVRRFPDLEVAVRSAVGRPGPSDVTDRAQRKREARLREALGAPPRRRGRPRK